MPRKNYAADAQRLGQALATYEATHGALPGILGNSEREVLIEQIIDSEGRVRYTDHLVARQLDPRSGDPRDPGFHPLKAAILHNRAGNFDEACWLVYLYVHFGMHKRAGWWYLSQMYGASNSTPASWWTWSATSNDPTSFRFWLDEHQDEFHAIAGPHGFGNHRKYVSLNAWSEQGTGASIESYVDWVIAGGGDHAKRFKTLESASANETFDATYQSLIAVRQFGRTARFDYLTMLNRLGLLEATAPHVYMTGASGPLTGAKLLFHGDKKADIKTKDAQVQLTELCEAIGVGPDILEDAICNWQKGPDKYVRFSA
jgi:hypothetical protein